MMPLYFGFHYWWLIIPGILLGLYAQFKLSTAYSKYSEIPARSGITGAGAAREILDAAGLTEIPVEEIDGHLTDHFDPSKKALFLSSSNYGGTSLAAVGVAAHEAGHALQQQAAYAPFSIRMAVVPVAQFGSSLYAIIGAVGFFLGGHWLRPFLGLAIVAFTITTVFQLITLPVEYDASRRAKRQLVSLGLVQNDEKSAIDHVLDAAALTYVAAMVTSLFTLLHLILIARDGDRNR